MRFITIIVILIVGFSCDSTKTASLRLSQLNGTWVPIKQEIGGKILEKTAFENQKLIINDSIYTVIAESTDKGVVRNRGNKMDIYGKEGVNAGKHFTAIYKYNNMQLTICYNLLGDSYPEEFETKSKPTLFLSIFQKEKIK
jgi:uncharacterized protein (TIGR03067 family)